MSDAQGMASAAGSEWVRARVRVRMALAEAQDIGTMSAPHTGLITDVGSSSHIQKVEGQVATSFALHS